MADEKKKEEEKKIIVDEDWKKEAQKEKEELAARQEAEEKKTDQDESKPRLMPPGDFAAMMSMLVTQALFAMGMIDVEGQERKTDLAVAKYNIDMLETLEEKTKGNLTKEEEKALSNMLGQVRMAYVKVAE